MGGRESVEPIGNQPVRTFSLVALPRHDPNPNHTTRERKRTVAFARAPEDVTELLISSAIFPVLLPTTRLYFEVVRESFFGNDILFPKIGFSTTR